MDHCVTNHRQLVVVRTQDGDECLLWDVHAPKLLHLRFALLLLLKQLVLSRYVPTV